MTSQFGTSVAFKFFEYKTLGGLMKRPSQLFVFVTLSIATALFFTACGESKDGNKGVAVRGTSKTGGNDQQKELLDRGQDQQSKLSGCEDLESEDGKACLVARIDIVSKGSANQIKIGSRNNFDRPSSLTESKSVEFYHNEDKNTLTVVDLKKTVSGNKAIVNLEIQINDAETFTIINEFTKDRLTSIESKGLAYKKYNEDAIVAWSAVCKTIACEDFKIVIDIRHALKKVEAPVQPSQPSMPSMPEKEDVPVVE